MAIGATINAVDSGASYDITVTRAGAVIYRCSYAKGAIQAMLATGKNGGPMTLAELKTTLLAEVQAMVQQIVAAQGAPAAVAGLDGQTF